MAAGDEILLHAKRFKVVRRTFPGAGGSLHVQEIVVHPGSVVILPLVTSDQICLIRNYRGSVGEALIELPAGTLDRVEEPADAARRELIEETGYRAGRIEKLLEFYPSPGILDERMQLFVATDLVPGEPARESGEQIDNLLMSAEDALDFVRSGGIRDAKTLVGLLFYQQFMRSQSR